IGPLDDLVVISSNGVEVFQVSPTSLLVRADRPGGEAIAIVRGPSGHRGIVFRGASPTEQRRDVPERYNADPSRGELALGGQYTYTQSLLDDRQALTMFHWADWQQA